MHGFATKAGQPAPWRFADALTGVPHKNPIQVKHDDVGVARLHDRDEPVVFANVLNLEALRQKPREYSSSSSGLSSISSTITASLMAPDCSSSSRSGDYIAKSPDSVDPCKRWLLHCRPRWLQSW